MIVRDAAAANLNAAVGRRSAGELHFQAQLKVADCAEVYSSGFQFKFDRNHADWANQVSETPWHVIPIWVDQPSEAVEDAKTTGLSYEIGSGNLIDGIDEAIIGTEPEDSRTFTTQLVAGEHAGQDAEVTVTVQSVKVRELPDARVGLPAMGVLNGRVRALLAELVPAG